MPYAFISTLQEIPLFRARVWTTVGGQTPRLLFVHGGFHGAWCWSPWLEHFAAHNIPAAAIDLTGHGGLQQPADFITLSLVDMARDVSAAARALGGDMILAGHSLGALTVMAAAAEVKPVGMILLAPAPPANVADVRLLPPFPTENPVAPPPPERARKWFFAGRDEVDAAAYAARLCPESPAFLNDLYSRSITVDPAWTTGPSLCVSGGSDDSPLHHAGQDEKIAAFYGAEFITVPDGGHCLMAEHNAAPALICDWLRRNGLVSPVS